MINRLALIACLLLTASCSDPKEQWLQPAEFRIQNNVIQKNPGPFTATLGRIEVEDVLFSGGFFEPLTFRTKFYANQSSDSELSPPIGGPKIFGTFRSGFWDGALARVFRIIDKKYVKVREGRVAKGGYIAQGWHLLENLQGRAVRKEVKEIKIVAARKFRAGIPYYFSIASVFDDGRESRKSEPLRFEMKQWDRQIDLPYLDPPKLNEEIDPHAFQIDAQVSAPRNFRLYMKDDGVLDLSWSIPPMKGLIGYRIYVSEYEPSKHLGFQMRLAGTPESERQKIQSNDMIFLSHEVQNFSRSQSIHGFKANAYQWQRPNELIHLWSDEHDAFDWKLSEHPKPIPADFVDRGKTCLEVHVKTKEEFRLTRFSHGHLAQGYYPILYEGRTYVAEGWARYQTEEDHIESVLEKPKAINRGKTNGKLVFQVDGFSDLPVEEGGIKPIEIEVDGEWRKFRVEFTPGHTFNNGVNYQFQFILQSKGFWWLDSLNVYPKDIGPFQSHPKMIEQARASHLEAMRFHTHIKSKWGHSMEMLTNRPGVIGSKGLHIPNSGYTLPSLLNFCRETKTNPWLQIEMFMDEREWHGLVEWLAAPYNPTVDTPESKPWAYKRYSQGQKKPWADEFDRIYFEVSNETWNNLFRPWVFWEAQDAATKEWYPRGAVYGLFQEYVISRLKESPYWTKELESKWFNVLGGWGAQGDSADDFGPAAKIHSPNSQFLTIGGYNGGWDIGEPPATMTNDSLFRSLNYWSQFQEIESRNFEYAESLDKINPMHFGTYEAGPGYALSGLNGQAKMTPEQIEAQDQVGKSQATGVSTLDAFLGRAELGYRLQNFFTFGFNRNYWTSHSAIQDGGHAYPSWKLLSLYNKEGTGDFLEVEMQSGPTKDLEPFASRPETDDAPMISVYATKKGKRVNVFVLSRKLDQMMFPEDDGFTPVTLQLPFSSAKTVTLYKMANNPRAHNLDSEEVTLEKMELIPFQQRFGLTNSTTGFKRNGIPPASAFLYVFEETNLD